MAPYDLGVDLGTTFVAAALWVDGSPEMFTLGADSGRGSGPMARAPLPMGTHGNISIKRWAGSTSYVAPVPVLMNRPESERAHRAVGVSPLSGSPTHGATSNVARASANGGSASAGSASL